MEYLDSGTSPAIGSVSRLYDLLEQASTITPVVGNQGGSYLTMKSDQGLVFGAITILSGFTGVFCDQGLALIHALSSLHFSNGIFCIGYWQRVSLTLCNMLMAEQVRQSQVIQSRPPRHTSVSRSWALKQADSSTDAWWYFLVCCSMGICILSRSECSRSYY